MYKMQQKVHHKGPEYCQKFINAQIKIQYIGKMHKKTQNVRRFVEEKFDCILKSVCYNFIWLKT